MQLFGPVRQVCARFVEQTVEVLRVAFALAVDDAPDFVLHLHDSVPASDRSRVDSDVDTRVDEIVEQFGLLFVVCRLVEEHTVAAVEIEALSATGV